MRTSTSTKGRGTALAPGLSMRVQPATPPLGSRQGDGRRETELMAEFQTRRDHPAFEALYRVAAPG
ncbi:MAG: hypothetical protein ACPGPE_08455, partial [Planctomycetota bacterium]